MAAARRDRRPSKASTPSVMRVSTTSPVRLAARSTVRATLDMAYRLSQSRRIGRQGLPGDNREIAGR